MGITAYIMWGFTMYSLKEQVLYKSTFIAVPSVLLYRDSTVYVFVYKVYTNIIYELYSNPYSVYYSQ